MNPATPDHSFDFDTTLRELGAMDESALELPPLSGDLEDELAKLEPVTLRRPLRRFAVFALASLAYGITVLWLTKLRPDLDGLPPLWFALYCGGWLAGFVALGWLALVPGRRKIMPDWRSAGIGAVIASIGYVGFGLLFARDAPGVSHLCNTDFPGTFAHGAGCLGLGSVTAIVPILLGTILLRGTVPVGSRWAGAALGAAGGALGGFTLHLHCNHADAMHLGLVHGGVVVIAAVLGALIIPRVAGR